MRAGKICRVCGEGTEAKYYHKHDLQWIISFLLCNLLKIRSQRQNMQSNARALFMALSSLYLLWKFAVTHHCKCASKVYWIGKFSNKFLQHWSVRRKNKTNLCFSRTSNDGENCREKINRRSFWWQKTESYNALSQSVLMPIQLQTIKLIQRNTKYVAEKMTSTKREEEIKFMIKFIMSDLTWK